MKKNTKKAMAGALSMAAIMAQPAAAIAAEAPAAVAALDSREEESFAEIQNVQGNFSFRQDEVTPADEIFNLFGTVATAACAKPGFAMDEIAEEEYYVNVKGTIKKEYALSLDQIKSKDAKQQVLKCSCAGGKALATAQVTGVPVSNVLEMADLEDGTNTITFRSADGYGIPMPLQYVLDKEAMLVYKIGDTELSAENGGSLQIWMPETVAKYFTRQVTEIELGKSEEVPGVAQPENTYQVSILNRFDDSFKVGDQISFEGYADDFNTAISAVEFSLDGGKTWTSYETANANPNLWVYWNFDYVAEEPGTYKLDVRAKGADGTVSPLASSVIFTVEDSAGTAEAI
jgi:DMSO/TMAO reductase YedYZ molybdopterin-dependent catalytic subunit